MKRLIFLGMFLLCAGSSFAQTADQYITAGNQSYAAKDYPKAVQYYQAAAQMNPNSAAAFQGLGNSQYLLGQNSDALASYQKALALNPNNTQLSSFVETLKAKVAAAPAASSVAVPTPAPGAAGSTNAGGSASTFELDVNAGLGFDGGQIGFGGGLGGFVPLDKSFSIGAMAGFYTFSVSASGSTSSGGVTYSGSGSSSINFIEGMGAVKYRFDGTNMKPYVFAGIGISDVMQSVSGGGSSSGGGSGSGTGSSSAVDPLLAIGGGVEFNAGNKMNIFAQLKESIVIVPGVTVTNPLTGASVSVGGGTASYTVVEGGLNFDM